MCLIPSFHIDKFSAVPIPDLQAWKKNRRATFPAGKQDSGFFFPDNLKYNIFKHLQLGHNLPRPQIKEISTATLLSGNPHVHPGEIIFQGISSTIQHDFESFVLEVSIHIHQIYLS